MSHAGERVVVEDYRATPEDYLIYLFHIATYRFAARYTEGRRVLDYGCGSGFGAAEIAGKAAAVVAVDVSPTAIEHARASFDAPGIEFATIGAGDPLPFPDESFDTVLSFQVIEHVAEPDRYLSEARRVLRPGGRIVLATPDRRTRLLPLQRPWNRWHLNEYSERGLRRLLSTHFGEVEVLGMTGRPDVIEIELRRTRRARWMALPATLPFVPDRLRTNLLARAQRLRARPAAPGPADPPAYDFDESAIRIGAGESPSVNLVAVGRR